MVVLIPPAVEPGLPPINIKMMLKSLLLSESCAISVVLKPAVLVVTESNRQVRNVSPPLSPSARFLD